MELLAIGTLATVVGIPAGVLIGLNIGTYTHTREWLESHNKIDISFNTEYENFRRQSTRGYLVYYFGLPGRMIAAYRFHYKK